MSRIPIDAIAAVDEVTSAFEKLGVEYFVGGSFASSIHGIPRATRDLDVVAELSPSQVGGLTAELAGRFYLDEGTIRDAIRRRASFNLIHLASGFKVDVFIAGRKPFDRIELRRVRPSTVISDPPRDLPLQSPEDSILRKLVWLQLGASDRQWTDALGILKVQGDGLDLDYLRRWAGTLGVEALVERLLAIPPESPR